MITTICVGVGCFFLGAAVHAVGVGDPRIRAHRRALKAALDPKTTPEVRATASAYLEANPLPTSRPGGKP